MFGSFHHHPSRDYWHEIEAAIASKLTSWQVQHLSLWSDYVEHKAAPIVLPDSEDVMVLEDQCQAAKFREIKAKLAADISSMTSFNASVAANKKRAHVVAVMHERGQIQQGKQ